MNKLNIFELAEPQDKEEVALETVDFQSNEFGKELEAVFEEILVKCKTAEDLTNGNYSDLLVRIVKKHTNLSVDINLKADSPVFGPCIMLPAISKDSVLFSDAQINHLPGYNFKELQDAIAKHKNKNGVNLKTGKVYGLFEDIKALIYFPARFILHLKLSPRELTAILLHEVGHLFTYFEYIDRTSTTNQVLASLAEEFTKVTTDGDKRNLVEDAVSLLDIKTKESEVLLKETDINKIFISLISYKHSPDNSQLTNDVYNRTSCEQLADAYASRYGYARDLATGLDKCGYLLSTSSATLRTILYLQGTSAPIFNLALLVIVPHVFIFAMAAASVAQALYMNRTDKLNMDYDESDVRLKRLREQLIQMSKNNKLDKIAVNYIADSIKELDKLIHNCARLGGLIRSFANLIIPSSRRAAESINLQRQLEELASNDLFLAAAKLRTI